MKGRHEVKTIPVNRGERCYEAKVDDEDYQFLSQYRWSFSGSSRTAYASTFIPTSEVYKCVRMHRMVIGDVEEDWNLTLGGYPLRVRLDNGKIIFIPCREISSF